MLATTQNNTQKPQNAGSSLLPVKITPFYMSKLLAEQEKLSGRHGPLCRTAYPPALRQATPYDTPDSVGDRPHLVNDSIIHKYKDRLLFLPTSRCAGHCQYCFRSDLLTEQHNNERSSNERNLTAKINQLTDYIQTQPQLQEVILSGGDPLTLGTGALQEIFSALHHVRPDLALRLHTRMLVFAPNALHNPEKIALLAKFNVRLVLHVVHPYELCDEVAETVAMLRSAKLRLYNQNPILAGVNDAAPVLMALLRRLDALDIQQLSFYVPDPVSYSAPYRVPMPILWQMMQELRWQTPSWLNHPPLVLDSPIGKLRREDLLLWHNAQTPEQPHKGVFMREGRQWHYTDLPEVLYQRGDAKTLLWQG